MDWVRLYHEVPTDPKWRVIAKRSGQCIPDVVAVYVYILVDASRNTMKRGETQCNAQNRYDEVAATYELEPADVQEILKAMEGVVVKNGKLMGWEKRNPVREDKSTQRVRHWRETQRNTLKHGNAPREEKIREEKKEDTDRVVLMDTPRVQKPRVVKSRTRIPDGFPDEEAQRRAQAFWTSKQRLDLAHSVREQAEQFRAHHTAHGKTMADWAAAWRTWVGNALQFNRVERSSGRHESPHRQTARIAAELIAEFEAGDSARDSHPHDSSGVMVLLEGSGGRPAEGPAAPDVRGPGRKI